jgi:hypothetical protein
MKTWFVVCLLALLSACADSVVSPPPPPPPVTVSVSFCDPFAPLWLGYQDGDGAWIRAEPTVANGTSEFRLTFSENRGAVAAVLVTAPGATLLRVVYATPAELASAGIDSPRFCGPTEVQTLLGSVAGLDSGDVALVRAGFGSLAVAHNGEDFALEYLGPGPRDILATREALGDPGDQRLTKIIVRRGLDLPDGARIPVLDFESPEAFAPVTGNVTLEGVGLDGAFVGTQLRTASNVDEFSLPNAPGADGMTLSYYALPESQLAAGELQELIATAHGGTPNASRTVRQYFRSAIDRTLQLGPVIIAPSFSTVATTPSLRLRAQFAPQDEYDRAASVAYTGDGPASVVLLMTAPYAALGGGYDLVNPELSGVAGFDPVWELLPEPVRWTATRLGGTLGVGIDPVPTDGAVQLAAFATDLLMP